MAITITTHPSSPDVLIKDVGVVIPGAGGSDQFDDMDNLRIFCKSQHLCELTCDNAFGPDEHTLTLSDATGPIAPACVPTCLQSLSMPLRGALGPAVIAVDLATEGPGAGFCPLKRTYSDGSEKTYTYKADGLSYNTVTVTRPGKDPVVYQAQYAASGVLSYWTT